MAHFDISGSVTSHRQIYLHMPAPRARHQPIVLHHESTIGSAPWHSVMPTLTNTNKIHYNDWCCLH